MSTKKNNSDVYSPNVYVVVLNWNGWRDTIRCLESVLQLEYSNYRVVVVDNGSEDDSIKYLLAWALDGRRPVMQDCACTVSEKKRLTTIEYSRMNAEHGGTDDGETTLSETPSNQGLVLVNTYENLGFAGGCNLGIAYALKRNAEYVLLLNNDAQIRPDALAQLVNVAGETGATIVGARIFNHDEGKIDFAGSQWPGQLFGIGGLQRSQQAGKYWPSSYASGCALIIRRDLLIRRLAECGYFLDANYFMYCEEVDLCLYGRSNGAQCLISNDAVVYHSNAASSGGRVNPRSYYYLTRNRIYLANRWLNTGWKIVFHLYYIPSRLVILIIRYGLDQVDASKAILNGLFDGYSNIMGKWQKHGTDIHIKTK